MEFKSTIDRLTDFGKIEDCLMDNGFRPPSDDISDSMVYHDGKLKVTLTISSGSGTRLLYTVTVEPVTIAWARQPKEAAWAAVHELTLKLIKACQPTSGYRQR